MFDHLLPKEVTCRKCGRMLLVRKNELCESTAVKQTREDGTIFVKTQMYRTLNVCCANCRAYNEVVLIAVNEKERISKYE